MIIAMGMDHVLLARVSLLENKVPKCLDKLTRHKEDDYSIWICDEPYLLSSSEIPEMTEFLNYLHGLNETGNVGDYNFGARIIGHWEGEYDLFGDPDIYDIYEDKRLDHPYN